MVGTATAGGAEAATGGSPDLPAHWARLDAFEGTDYRRAAIDVVTDQGRVPAWIYVHAGVGG